jgi:hypothetical protein
MIRWGEKMKWNIYLAACVIGTMVLVATASAADASAGEFNALVARITKASRAKSQPTYSQQLRKSVNAAAVQRLEKTCASDHAADRVQTFTMVGVMRLDGVFRAPTPLPDNDFTRCVAKNMGSVTFPLPPGNQQGWPVAIQFDGATGKVLYMAGDRQPALPMYQQPRMATMPWMYTPVPLVPKGVHKSCTVSVWVTVGTSGRVDEVDMDDSSCPSRMGKDVEADAHQWIYKVGAHRTESMDVRLSFDIGMSRVRVKL